ncbi:hypothetical protein [Nostoc sp.]
MGFGEAARSSQDSRRNATGHPPADVNLSLWYLGNHSLVVPRVEQVA